MFKKTVSSILAFAMIASMLLVAAPLATAAGNREVEPNNSMNQATPMGLNADMYGNIESNNDVDFFVFTIPNKGSVSLTFNYYSGTPAHRVALLDSSNQSVNSNTFTSSSVVFPYTSLRFRLPAGTYYVRIDRPSGYTLASNEYTIKVNYADESSGNFESEPNNSINQANPITNGQDITGNIHNDSDVDFYTFTLPGNGSLNLVFNYLQGNPAHRITLLDSSNSTVSSQTLTSASVAFPYKTPIYRVAAGTYYVRIDRPSGYTLAPNDYTLRYEFTDETGKAFEIEPNNTTNTATAIGFNTPWTGNIHSDGDVDYYKFEVSGSQSISLTFNYSSGTPSFRIRLIDSANKNLISQTLTSASTVFPYTTSEVSVTSGTYYIIIDRPSGYTLAPNDYTIRVNGAGGSITPPAPEPSPEPSPEPGTPPDTAPEPINNFNGEQVSLIGIKLQWNAIQGSVGYRVFRSETQGELGIPATDFYCQFHEYIDVNVKPNTTYYYTIKQILVEATIYGDPEVYGAESAQVRATAPDKIIGDNLDRPDTSAQKKVIVMQIDDPMMTLPNGKTQEIDPGRGTMPIIRNDRTLSPIRAIVEDGMGGTVDWDGDAREVSLTFKQNNVRMWIDNDTIRVNGSPLQIDVAPTIINDRTMLPARAVIEGLGGAIEFINTTRQIVIVYY